MEGKDSFLYIIAVIFSSITTLWLQARGTPPFACVLFVVGCGLLIGNRFKGLLL